MSKGRSLPTGSGRRPAAPARAPAPAAAARGVLEPGAGERVALLSALLAVREVAARATLRQLPPVRKASATADAPVPERSGLLDLVTRLAQRGAAETPPAGGQAPQDRERQDAFHQALATRLRALLTLPPLPRLCVELLSWLIRIDLPTAHASRPDALSLSEFEAWQVAWSTVLGMPLQAWVCSDSEVGNAKRVERQVRPLLRSVRLATADAEDRDPLDADHSQEHPDSEPLDIEACWSRIVGDAALLPPVEAVGWRVWLDAFNSLLDQALAPVSVFRAEPSPKDRLVDATRLAAAGAACMVSRHSHRNGDTGSGGYRLVSIEFIPIQDFIFNIPPQSPWRTDAALGGRSSFVRLMVDLGALLVLDRLDLPACCILNSAASKSLVLVPDAKACTSELGRLATSFDTWAIRELAGTGGLSLAHVPIPPGAICLKAAHPKSTPHSPLEPLARRAAVARLNRFGLARNQSPLLVSLWSDLQRCRSVCTLDGVTPGVPEHASDLESVCAQSLREPPPLSPSSRMQLSLARDLAVADVLVAARLPSGGTAESDGVRAWHFLDLTLSLTKGPATVDAATSLAAWDIGYGARPPQERHFKGLAIRPIALPRGRWQPGPVAMLKGDVDRLGQVFQRGLADVTLGRSIRLSREVEDFFSIHLPALLQRYFPQVQTVLCGGDDFAFVGPASVIPALASRLHEAFTNYCGNPALTFSAGMCVADAATSIADITEQAELALAEAKRTRASICAHDVSVTWSEWLVLNELQGRIALELRGERVETVRCLDRICTLIASCEEPRSFTGVRWKALVRSAISTYVERTDNKSAAASARFWRLVVLLEDKGFGRHGRALRIPLQNLYHAYFASEAYKPPGGMER